MPQGIIDITRFGGLYTNPHQEDIPDSAASFSLNVDPMALSGTLQGMPVTGATYTANSVALPNIYEADWLKYEVSGAPRWDLVYIDKNGGDISVVENFYAAEASRTFNDLVTSPGATPKCCKTFNEQVQIGLGDGTNSTNDRPWVVYRQLNSKGFFDDSETEAAGVKATYGICRNQSVGSGDYSIAVALGGAAGGYFQEGILYSWKITVAFDGLQESNLGIGQTDTGAAGGESTCTVTITAINAQTNFSSFDKRATGIKIYRAESSDGTSANLGLYRLVDTVDINASGWTDSGANCTYAYTDNGGYPGGGATYEEETGILETINLSYLHYGMNEVGGGYHWVAKTYMPDTVNSEPSQVDWSRYIFRSKKFRPNMFNWARDFLVLPRVPTALAFYGNYLYAFSENEVYKINPELLIVEDIFTGAGCSNRQAVTVTEFGMFFCNVNACYQMHPEGVIETISDAISEDSPIHTTMDGWRTMANFTLYDASAVLDKLMVFYETDKRSVLFFVEGTNVADTLEAFAYFIPTKEWYYWRLGTYNNITVNSGAFNGKDGEIYVSGDTGTGRLFAAATFTNSGWASKEFNLDEPSQNKSWNMVKWDAVAGSGAVTVSYATEGTSAVSSGTPATSGAWINTYKKTFQIYATTTSNARIDSLDIIVRPLYGKR